MADFKAKFDVLVIRAKLPAANQLFYWYCGLKPELHRQTTVDALTSRTYTSIKAAQTAAQTYDSCYGVGEKVTATTHILMLQKVSSTSCVAIGMMSVEMGGMSLTVNLGAINGICDSTFHTSYDCPRRSQTHIDTDDRRFVCGKTGHITRDCSAKS